MYCTICETRNDKTVKPLVEKNTVNLTYLFIYWTTTLLWLHYIRDCEQINLHTIEATQINSTDGQCQRLRERIQWNNLWRNWTYPNNFVIFSKTNWLFINWSEIDIIFNFLAHPLCFWPFSLVSPVPAGRPLSPAHSEIP